APKFNLMGQAHKCEIEVFQLRFLNQETQSEKMSDSLLATAILTSTILISNDEIQMFEVKTDSACCNYSGQMFLTSHRYVLERSAVSRISSLQIPLCCGIPLAFYVDGKEVYRAMLWNKVSSFDNESITATLFGNTLAVSNQLPAIPDFRNNILVSKENSIICL